MRTLTKKQTKNLKEALLMWETVPAGNVTRGLDHWRKEPYAQPDLSRAPTCNTIACFGGWCAHWPEFQRQGVRPAPVSGAPKIGNLDPVEVSELLFGHHQLFSARGNSELDDAGIYSLSDHEVITYRLNRLLKESSWTAKA